VDRGGAWIDESKTKTGYENQFYQKIFESVEFVAQVGLNQSRYSGSGRKFPGAGKAVLEE
jgi:hypothetical protein